MEPREEERINQKKDVDVRRPEIEPDEREGLEVDSDEKRAGNPPHTETGGFSAPKFGSAGSGGAEYEGPAGKN